jgi:hypothetical protein
MHFIESLPVVPAIELGPAEAIDPGEIGILRERDAPEQETPSDRKTHGTHGMLATNPGRR